MRKIVINECFGGFGLSYKGMMRYSELTGVTLFPYLERQRGKCQDYDGTETGQLIHYSTKPLKDGVYEEGSYFSDRDIKRDDPSLVQVVEEMGEAAHDDHAELKIVEIPEDVEWVIDDYDGVEHVAEKHRTWS